MVGRKISAMKEMSLDVILLEIHKEALDLDA
jgi:hypothetical protein